MYFIFIGLLRAFWLSKWNLPSEVVGCSGWSRHQTPEIYPFIGNYGPQMIHLFDQSKSKWRSEYFISCGLRYLKARQHAIWNWKNIIVRDWWCSLRIRFHTAKQEVSCSIPVNSWRRGKTYVNKEVIKGIISCFPCWPVLTY